MKVNVSAGKVPYNYIWSDDNSTTSDIIENVRKGLYKVTVIDDKSCNGIDSITITQPEKVSANIVVDSISCYNYSDGEVTINGIKGSGPYTYVWDDEIVEGNIVSGLSANIKYILEVYDSKNCYSDKISIKLNQPYILKVAKDTDNTVKPFCSDDFGGMLAIKIKGGTGPYSYNWTGYESQFNQILEGVKEGYYEVEITDANSCIFDTTIFLEAENITCLDIPNVFTPNDIPDDRNDFWDIRYRGDEGKNLNDIYPNAGIKVYNRFGRLVFECKGGSCPDKWDGRYQGKKLPVDSYYYIIELNNGSGKIYKGTLTILY